MDDGEIAGLFNHNPDLLLGRVGAGTMRLEDTEGGVRYDIDGSNRSYALDLRESLRLKEVTRSSFAFRIARQGDVWEEDEESGLLIRTIHKFSRLYDMSPVTYAAYPETDAGERSDQSSESGDESDPDTAARVERTDDGPAGERVQDGDEEQQQAGEPSEREKRKERLRIRVGEPRL